MTSSAALDHPAVQQDQDLVREVPGGGQVVGDVKDAEVLLPLQGGEQVEHGHRLVGDQDARLGGERPGDRDPLPPR